MATAGQADARHARADPAAALRGATSTQSRVAADRAHLQPLLEIAGIAELVDLAKSAEHIEHTKPDPETLEAALATLPVERLRAVMIGDTPYDVEAARAANIDVIGFTCGAWSAEALGGAVAIYAGPADLVTRWSSSPLGRELTLG